MTNSLAFFLALHTLIFGVMLTACSSQKSFDLQILKDQTQALYSSKGQEVKVSFSALYESKATTLNEFRSQPKAELVEQIRATTFFLYGPLVTRSLGSPLEGETIEVFRDEAQVVEGMVMVPYRYQATWLVSRQFPQKFHKAFPLPYQSDLQRTAEWKKCGDPLPEHQSTDWLWYFWDPSRAGCDQKVWVDYQNVELLFEGETAQTKESFPEYSRMAHLQPGGRTLAMTFAFGAFNEELDLDPFQSKDAGLVQFRKFHRQLEKILKPEGFEVLPVYQSEFGGNSKLQIGSRFQGFQNKVRVEISVLAAVGASNVQLFAESFAARKEAFFGWFGHTMVGSGYELQTFKDLLKKNSEKYSISQAYQLVYWNGCNSYSYYAQPLFRLKGGSQNLDVISNALPAIFQLNAQQALTVFSALWNSQQKMSYQKLLRQLENQTYEVYGEKGLVTVQGDEDNP